MSFHKNSTKGSFIVETVIVLLFSFLNYGEIYMCVFKKLFNCQQSPLKELVVTNILNQQKYKP